jgi:DNA-binding beta-propeller fold protein YncE
MKTQRKLPIAGLLALAAISSGQAQAKSSADYELVGDYKLGAPNFWDYLTFDANSQRIYIAHIDRIEVVDARSGKPVGNVAPFHDTHGIAIVAELNKGYADSGDDGVVKVFDLKDLHIVKTIKVSADADGVAYEPLSRNVLVVAGDSKNLTIISAAEDKVIKTVPLPGKPEFLALDAHGHAFINIADSGSIAEVDVAAGAVTATWPLSGCERPHGIAYDPQTNRLFSGCANLVMVVVDASSGKNLARLPIGPSSDAIVMDPKRRRAMSANGDGTLTVVSVGDGDSYTVQRTIPTFFGGRNAAIDAASGTVFIAHGNMKLMSSTKDTAQLRFGFDGLNLAIFKPAD